MIGLLLQKIRFDLHADRLGPGIPFIHRRLYFKPLMLELYKEKFKCFADSAKIRPGVYVVTCSKLVGGVPARVIKYL